MGRTVHVDDLVSATEIGQRLNRDRNIVHTWPRSRPELPPVTNLKIGHIWEWAVEDWARATGRLESDGAPAMDRKVDLDDLVSAREIVDRLRVTCVNTVHSWRHRYADFPSPSSSSASGSSGTARRSRSGPG